MIAALGGQAIKPKGIEKMVYALFYALLLAALVIGVCGVIGAIKSFEGDK